MKQARYITLLLSGKKPGNACSICALQGGVCARAREREISRKINLQFADFTSLLSENTKDRRSMSLYLYRAISCTNRCWTWFCCPFTDVPEENCLLNISKMKYWHWRPGCHFHKPSCIRYILHTINHKWRWIFDSSYSLSLSIQILAQL